MMTDTIPCVVIVPMKDGKQTEQAEILYFASDNSDAWDNARRLADELLSDVKQGHDNGVSFFVGLSKKEWESVLPNREVVFKEKYIMVANLQLHEVLNYLLQINFSNADRFRKLIKPTISRIMSR